MIIRYEQSYYKEIEDAKKRGLPIILPVGTMEYHSTICPYGTDTLVASGIAEKFGEKTDCVILPPVWYGVASYAVAGPEKNTLNVDCDTLENYIYAILKSLFLSGFTKNVYIFIAHQTEDYMPMTLACMKASKKLIMEYMEQTHGIGWWGNPKYANFFDNLSPSLSPWNMIRTVLFPSHAVSQKFGSDHAGKWECSMLSYLYPNSVKLDRLIDANDWFSKTAKDMTADVGKQMIDMTIDELLVLLKGE